MMMIHAEPLFIITDNNALAIKLIVCELAALLSQLYKIKL